ncbi:fatty acyl-CoA reductase wat-like [Bradysia coprophila]|uniref:fatty acyl-CoA reductase wat-like n=1 Tax=Bradysia coprophila TaxID=38358 RepID=UPI00187DA277|nr:fatty acyl-CoA reductase wat-like [Bradysia coprophila]XP_037045454.1 fatty acyl-CoA reductase wat-like [Bradysia coprophila]XP_037045455.1 fatty acyl-CoA reductase wat-like [Bradysia coprophila]XP_037045456.1 fatty acyl-CoA reductase wat-like [Bradysia coprophila]
MDIVTRKNEENRKLSQSNLNGLDNKLSELQKFYDGKNVFVTGGTGFMGKMLIDKLLRTCPGIENIYLLVRPKKGKDIHTRLDEIFDDLVFERLHEEVPKFRHKIVAIHGDCALAGLGLNLIDRQTLISNVQLVFHAAATVRFDEKLKLAVGINVCGTQEVLELCTHMTKLEVVMHVSTVYSNCHLRFIEEKFYKFPFHFNDLNRLIEKLDDKSLEEVTPTILGKWPNTYTFTKALAEDVVRINGRNLPIGLFRPAIITSSVKEPVVGYIDNLYGPTGVVYGAGTGVLRTMHCDRDVVANIVPVDMTVNALIAASWDVAVNRERSTNTEDIPVYNYVSSVEKPLTWGEFTDYNIKYGFEQPFSSAIWYLSFHTHKTAMMHSIYVIFLHILPAMLIDSLALCVGQRPQLLKVYKKIHKFADVISFFATNEWMFTNNNIQRMWNRLSVRDQAMFNFNMKTMDWVDYLHHYIPGMRKYLLKDDMSTVEAARRKWNRFYWLHQMLKTVLSLIILYFFWSTFSDYIYRCF